LILIAAHAVTKNRLDGGFFGFNNRNMDVERLGNTMKKVKSWLTIHAIRSVTNGWKTDFFSESFQD